MARPDLGEDYQDYVITQGNYNMALAVKPDDPEIVLIGATTLFRSRDGFATPADTYDNLIGGYLDAPPAWRYPNLHVDIHAFFFDPQDPDRIWVGTDGGLSYATDIGVPTT